MGEYQDDLKVAAQGYVWHSMTLIPSLMRARKRQQFFYINNIYTLLKL
jgi:hypothetical protein